MATKNYRGAPFGTQTSRKGLGMPKLFDVSGVHPHNKLPGTYTQVPYCKRATSKENRRLGPGTHNLESRDFSASALEMKRRGPNWDHAYNTAKYNGIPCLYYREQCLHNKWLKEQLGPGKYETKDFIKLLSEKPSSNRGVCETSEPRFPRENIFRSKIPGPGTYSKPVVTLTCAKINAKGLLGSGIGHHLNVATGGSGLAPGRYEHRNTIEDLLEKIVSIRGPYDLYSGERNTVPKTTLERVHLGPGKYEYKSFTDILDDVHSKKHGCISGYSQYPEFPTERNYCCTLSQWPRDKNAPGPSEYHLTGGDSTQTQSVPVNMHPFNISSKRFNQREFYRSINPVGVGQYDIDRLQHHRSRNGSTSVFISKTPRLPPKVNAPRELLLSERVSPKQIALDRKLNLDPFSAVY